MKQRLEDTLPENESLEGMVAELRDVLHYEVELLKAENADSDIVNHDIELDRPAIMLLALAERAAYQYLAEEGNCIADEANVRQVRDAIYRAICFGAQLTNDLLSRHSYNIAGYIVDQTSGTCEFALLAEDVAIYLRSRAELTAFIEYYMPEIDPSNLYGHVAEVYIGLSLMLAERSVAERYITAQAENADISAFLGSEEE